MAEPQLLGAPLGVGVMLAELKSCRNSGDVGRGRALHRAAAENGGLANVYVASSLVDMYAKCSLLEEARRLFDSMQWPDTVTWNALMFGYVENGQAQRALDLYACMQLEQEEGSRPDPRAVVAALKACRALSVLEVAGAGSVNFKASALAKGMSIHRQAGSSSSSLDGFVASTLMDVYCKCRRLGEARRVFDDMASSEQRSPVSWNVLIRGYVENGQVDMALELFELMVQRCGVLPDARTFVAALKACACLAERQEAKESVLAKVMRIHSLAMTHGCERDVYVASTLVDVYAKCRSLDDARCVFEGLMHRDVVCWTSMILGYAESGEGERALELFRRMVSEGYVADAPCFVAVLKACTSLADAKVGRQLDVNVVKPEILSLCAGIHAQAARSGCEKHIFVSSSLLDLYAKSGSLVYARRVFDRMDYRDAVCWTPLMMGYAESGEGTLGLELFDRMQSEGFQPNVLSVVAAVKSCSSLPLQEPQKLAKMKSLEELAAGRGFMSDEYLANTLVSGYAKCSSLEDARRVFEKMEHHGVVSWNALMYGYVENGEGKLALGLFSCMTATPNANSYVAALKACAMTTSVELGRKIHEAVRDGGLGDEPSVASSLVDFYGKCGLMSEAQQVFDSTTRKDSVTWNSLLAAYGRQGDIGRLFELFDEMRDSAVGPNGVTFLCLLTACSHAGLVDKGKKLFEVMSSKYGVRRELEHYTCMVDILGRANELQDALAMVEGMPMEPDAVLWTSLLAVCRKWKNVEIGRRAFEALMAMPDGQDPTAYVLMENIYKSSLPLD